MGPGVLSLALATLAFAPQGAGLPPNLQRVQDASVAAERREEFFAKYEAADEERKAEAAAALAKLRPAGRRLDGWPTTDELALAIRVLDGGELEELEADPLVAFADALGLLVVPGVADVDPERGEPLTVRVHLTKRAVLAGVVELSLHWRAPDGTEGRARTEPFPAEVFLKGFPMYVRAPKAAGEWELVPEVAHEGRTLRGFGVPVVTVADLDRRIEAPEFEEPSPKWDGSRAPGYAERIELLRKYGIRTADGPGVEGWLDDTAFTTRSPLSKAHLVVVTSRDEGVGAFHYGRLGARWRDLAGELGMGLHVMGAADLSQVAFGSPVFVLARGDAVADLHMTLLGKDVDVAGLLLSTSMDEPGPALPDVPTLIIGPSTNTGGPTPFLTEPELPELVRAWLEEQLE